MLAAVKIKEEPLDDEEIDDLQEVLLKQQETLIKQQIDPTFVECNNNKTLNNFQIVDEQERIITVSAAEMRSEDELKFIDSISNTSTQTSKFRGVCSKCLKQFRNRSQFLKHTKRNNCVTKQKCPVCPVTFIDAVSLLNHLNLHRENYFFCNHHCGASFQTLPLCEEHELKEHKTQVAPKIRYKHFCSFCREGFKTELQLHVHWLEQVQGCGKLMQDVVLHSTTVANNNNLNNKSDKSNDLDLQKQLSTTNTVSTVPITKLRLKACPTMGTAAAIATTNKRQTSAEQDNGAMILKRIKLLDKIKADMESNQLPFNFENDIKIKEEPIDEYESNMTTNLIPEVIIKTEEEEEEEEQKPQVEYKPETAAVEMKSMIINNMIGPESSGKFIPIDNFTLPKSTNIKPLVINNSAKSNINGKLLNVNSNNSPVLKIIPNNNNSMNINNSNVIWHNEANLRLVKLTPASIASVNKACNNTTTFSNEKNPNPLNGGKFMTLKLQNTMQNLNDVDVKPLLKNGLQIIKLVPHTQINTLKTNTNNANDNANANVNNKSNLVLKLMTCPTTTANSASLLTTMQQTPATVTVTKASSSSTNTSPTNSSAVSIKLTSINHNTTIDAEDFKKLQAEALIKAEEHRKNFYIPKTRLMIIENIPEKKQLIDNMKQQIAKVETKSSEQVIKCKTENFILNTKQPDEPPILYLPILTKIDVALVQARCQNPNYNFKWICPYCQKDYEIKRALKSHLINAHNLNNRDMEKINVQAKPFKMESEELLVVKEEPANQQEDINDSQTVTSETESINADNFTSPKSPKVTKQVKNSNNRYRFVCDKCGRSCSSKTMLNDHILANCSREPQYSCKECNKKFYSHGTLQCHMTIHTGELPHKCSYCDKRFRTRGQVKVHHRTHTGERPFFCQVCSQRFTHRETLIAHLSRHIGMKRYKCYGCDKHFSCISALKTHREIRVDTCGKVKFNPRAIGPRVRVIRGNVIFEPQPEINPYLKSEDPKTVLSELQNQARPSS